MLCNKLNSTDSTATLIAKTHRQKIVSTTNKSIDDGAKKQSGNISALINRGGGDGAANDILNREFPKMKLDNGKAMIVLLCERNSHPFETRLIPLIPHTPCTIGRISSKCRPSQTNAYFDCKVLSRNQAMIWYDDEHAFWIKDTQSSNGTYLNGSKLTDEAVQLHSGDLIQFGLNVYENKCSEVYSCIVASVQLYLPKIMNAKEEAREDQCEILVNPKKLIQMSTIEKFEEHQDLCETSRTTIENDVADKSLKLSTTSRISDAARRICINFKDDKSDKAIKIELHSIQSFIEAISNNKFEAWDSISKEDDYLQRIYMLQNKISILKKSISEDEFKIEKQQWEKEKHFYKRTAKDAIRRVTSECKEVALKIEQVEMKYKNLENECDMLRDQIDAKDQSINDFSCLLRHIEIDYDEYKTEVKTKNVKLHAALEQRIDDLLAQIRKLEMERENLIEKLEELKEFENEKIGNHFEFDMETKVECSKVIDEDDVYNGEEITNSQLIQVPNKFEQLEKILMNFEKQDAEFSEIENFLKFKQTLMELLFQFTELKMLQVKAENALPEVEAIGVELIKPRKCVANTREVGEQTNYLDDFEIQLEELRAKLAEQELNAEQLCDMLESECDLCRKKLMELQQENLKLVLNQEEAIAENTVKYTEVAVDAVKNTDVGYEVILKNIKAEYAFGMNENMAQLADTEQQLAVCKERLSQSQAEHSKLEAELDVVTEIAQKQQEQQHIKLLPILVPIFLGLFGMCVYLIMGCFS